jgi:hypothetical protein
MVGATRQGHFNKLHRIGMHIQPVFAFGAACLLSGCTVLASNEAIVFCQAADTVTTLQAVDLGAREANPVVDRLLTEFGPGGFVAAKIAVTLLFLHYYPELSSDVVIFVNGVTCAVAAHNAVITGKVEGKTAGRE